MIKKSLAAIFTITLMLLSTGCSTTAMSAGGNPNGYSRGQVFTPGDVFQGVILQARKVRIKGDTTSKLVGTAGGGILGALLASSAGGYVQIAAGLAGAVGGNVISSLASETDGFEIVIRFNQEVEIKGVKIKPTIVLVQEKDGNSPDPVAGDEVLVLRNGSEIRAVPMTMAKSK